VTAVNLDLRPESPAVLLLQEQWSEDDIGHLAERATDLAQDSVSFLGLDLDLREDASRWFGGEVAVASVVAGANSHPLSPRSLVLIARVTDLRRARHDLDQATSELAKEHAWERFSRRSDGRAIVFWGPSVDRSQIAYCASDGCVVVSPSADVVDLCLQAARASTERLTDTANFRETRGQLPGNTFFWCYSQTGELLRVAYGLLPSLRQSWLGLLRAYLHTSDASQPPLPDPPASGPFALAVLPETDGLSVYANYWRGAPDPTELVEQGPPALVRYVPREAIGYAFVRDARGFVSALTPGASAVRQQAQRLPFLMWGPLGLLFREESIPESVLVTALPGDSKPRLGFAMTGGETAQTGKLLQQLFPQGESAQTDDASLFGADAECVQQLRRAGTDRENRLQVVVDPEVRVQLWARPGEFTPRLSAIEEVQLAIRRKALGGTAQLRLKAEPSRLLGD
jgi:hypothetical protein